MGPTVIYEEEEVTLLDLASASEVDVATTATSQPLTQNNVANAGVPLAFARWASERESLTPQVVGSKAELEAHTGLNDWRAYIANPECAKMMKDLLTVPFVGAEAQLAKHWPGFFHGKIAAALMTAFKEKVRAEVFVPTLMNPSASDPLEGRLISYANGQVKTIHDKLPGFSAVDERFKLRQILVILSWGDVRPWSIIIPGKGYVQPSTFYYTDSSGMKWDSGSVISEVYLQRLEVEKMRAHFARLRTVYDKMTSYFSVSRAHSALERRVQMLDRRISAWSKVSLPTKTVNDLLQRAELFESGDPAAPRGLLLEGPAGTGKTLVARSFAESINCYFEATTLADLKQKELGASSQKVRELFNRARQKQPAILFFDECEGVFGRRGAAETDVITDEIVKTILSEWNDSNVRQRILVIGATNRPDMIDSAILSRFDWKLTVALPDQSERLDILKREIKIVAGDCEVPEEMGELTQGMSGRDLRNLATQVRTLAYPSSPSTEHFYAAVQSTRKASNTKVDQNAKWETLAVDSKTLEQLQLTCQLLRNAESWRAKGIEVPQSLLLFGLPGVGKTQVGRTLANESGLSFMAATTADMKGSFLGHSGNRIKLLFERARSQAPAILFLDELDIVAPKRGASNDPLTEEIVGQLLQEMDGIVRHDSQVFVVAATNKPDSIDPAILSRFLKRIEVPLPDLQSRVKLLSTVLAKKKLSFELGAGAEAIAARTEGKSHRDLIGYVGMAEEKALMRAISDGGPEHFSLKLEDFE